MAKIFSKFGAVRTENLGDLQSGDVALNILLDRIKGGADSFSSLDIALLKGIFATEVDSDTLSSASDVTVKITDSNGVSSPYDPLITLTNRFDRAYFTTSEPFFFGGDGPTARYFDSTQILRLTPGESRSEFNGFDQLISTSPDDGRVIPNPITGEELASDVDNFWEEGSFVYGNKIKNKLISAYGGVEWTGYFKPTTTGVHTWRASVTGFLKVEFDNQEAPSKGFTFDPSTGTFKIDDTDFRNPEGLTTKVDQSRLEDAGIPKEASISGNISNLSDAGTIYGVFGEGGTLSFISQTLANPAADGVGFEIARDIQFGDLYVSRIVGTSADLYTAGDTFVIDGNNVGQPGNDITVTLDAVGGYYIYDNLTESITGNLLGTTRNITIDLGFLQAYESYKFRISYFIDEDAVSKMNEFQVSGSINKVFDLDWRRPNSATFGEFDYKYLYGDRYFDFYKIGDFKKFVDSSISLGGSKIFNKGAIGETTSSVEGTPGDGYSSLVNLNPVVSYYTPPLNKSIDELVVQRSGDGSAGFFTISLSDIDPVTSQPLPNRTEFLEVGNYVVADGVPVGTRVREIINDSSVLVDLPLEETFTNALVKFIPHKGLVAFGGIYPDYANLGSNGGYFTGTAADADGFILGRRGIEQVEPKSGNIVVLDDGGKFYNPDGTLFPNPADPSELPTVASSVIAAGTGFTPSQSYTDQEGAGLTILVTETTGSLITNTSYQTPTGGTAFATFTLNASETNTATYTGQNAFGGADVNGSLNNPGDTINFTDQANCWTLTPTVSGGADIVLDFDIQGGFGGGVEGGDPARITGSIKLASGQSYLVIVGSTGEADGTATDEKRGGAGAAGLGSGTTAFSGGGSSALIFGDLTDNNTLSAQRTNALIVAAGGGGATEFTGVEGGAGGTPSPGGDGDVGTGGGKGAISTTSGSGIGGAGGVGGEPISFSQTFASNDEITIPSGVTEVNYEIHGGKGGQGGWHTSGNRSNPNPTFPAGPEGTPGQKITGTLTNVEGLTLQLSIGQQGSAPPSQFFGFGAGNIGGSGGAGYINGGQGGNDNSIPSNDSGFTFNGGPGGGGGGASAITSGTDILVVAGGGGGSAPVGYARFDIEYGTTSARLNDTIPTPTATPITGSNSGSSFNSAGGGGGGGYRPQSDSIQNDYTINVGPGTVAAPSDPHPAFPELFGRNNTVNWGGFGSPSGNDSSGGGGNGGEGYYNPAFNIDGTTTPPTLEQSTVADGFITISYEIPGGSGEAGDLWIAGEGGGGINPGGGGGGGLYGGGGGRGDQDTVPGSGAGGGGSSYINFSFGNNGGIVDYVVTDAGDPSLYPSTYPTSNFTYDAGGTLATIQVSTVFGAFTSGQYGTNSDGTGATFTVGRNEFGALDVQVLTRGKGYANYDLITIPGNLIGQPSDDLTLEVRALEDTFIIGKPQYVIQPGQIFKSAALPATSDIQYIDKYTNPLVESTRFTKDNQIIKRLYTSSDKDTSSPDSGLLLNNTILWQDKLDDSEGEVTTLYNGGNQYNTGLWFIYETFGLVNNSLGGYCQGVFDARIEQILNVLANNGGYTTNVLPSDTPTATPAGTTTVSGVGTDMTVWYKTDGNLITYIWVADPGTGYVAGDVVSINGSATPATFTVGYPDTGANTVTFRVSGSEVEFATGAALNGYYAHLFPSLAYNSPTNDINDLVGEVRIATNGVEYPILASEDPGALGTYLDEAVLVTLEHESGSDLQNNDISYVDTVVTRITFTPPAVPNQNKEICFRPTDTSPPFAATATGLATSNEVKMVDTFGGPFNPGKLTYDNINLSTNRTLNEISIDSSITSQDIIGGYVPITCDDGFGGTETYYLLLHGDRDGGLNGPV